MHDWMSYSGEPWIAKGPSIRPLMMASGQACFDTSAWKTKILLPAAQRLGGKPLPIAQALRLDHGALACLLMPTPTSAIIIALRAIITRHNRLEEGPDGLYECCERLAGSEAAALLEHLRAAPDVTVMPHSDSRQVLETVRRAVARARYSLPHTGKESDG